MNEPEPVRVETEIAEFAAILSTGHGEEVPVIVGGHAAGLWSRYYLARGIAELEGFVPFRSKDLDLLGTMSILESLHRRFKGKLTLSEPRSPVFGRLEIPRHGGGFLRVEVLHTVLGLRAKDLKRTVVVEVDGVAGRIPLPHLVLKAKLANAALLSQEGRQDVKHTRMMPLCVRGLGVVVGLVRPFPGTAGHGRGERGMRRFADAHFRVARREAAG
jgi:hypothetical protein